MGVAVGIELDRDETAIPDLRRRPRAPSGDRPRHGSLGTDSDVTDIEGAASVVPVRHHAVARGRHEGKGHREGKHHEERYEPREPQRSPLCLNALTTWVPIHPIAISPTTTSAAGIASPEDGRADSVARPAVMSHTAGNNKAPLRTSSKR